MRRILFGLVLLVYTQISFAQTSSPKNVSLEEVKDDFLLRLRSISADSAVAHPLALYFDAEVDAMHAWIRKRSKLSADEKQKSLRSLIFFIRELDRHLVQRKLSIYDIPGTVDSYKKVLEAIVARQPLIPALELSGPFRSQLVASAFSQYQEHRLLDDIAVYKRVASSPEFILPFLENKPGFRFTDSLLLSAAANDPQKIVYYLAKNRPGVQDQIRKADNPYLRQIHLLSADRNVSELLPFITQIAENKITPEEILTKRLEVMAYFQLLVNTLQQSVTTSKQEPVFLNPIRKGVKEKAIAFYVNEVNNLHDEKDEIRFAAVKGLRPQDLYYIITSCGEELYTSSYLGLYKRLMKNYEASVADSLFDIVQYDQFRDFIRLAANYNVLPDLLQRLSPERRSAILKMFTSRIEKDENTALEKAMDIADSFTALAVDSATADFVQSELNANLLRCKKEQHYLGVRLYGILTDVFRMVRQQNGLKELWQVLGDYEELKRVTLEDKNGQITQLVLFYGDDDGVLSFNNFLRLFADKNKWRPERTENWVSFRSITDDKIVIYANRPLDIKDELDRKAQDSLMDHLKRNSLQPTILVHRGHSYHLDKTMQRLTPNVKLAILGSCGGYNRAISIAKINPDVQVIGSKKTGTGSVNDPLIDEINKMLVDKKDISWPGVWANLSNRFSRDQTAMNLFNEYFPPANNLGLFVLKLFNYYNRHL